MQSCFSRQWEKYFLQVKRFQQTNSAAFECGLAGNGENVCCMQNFFSKLKQWRKYVLRVKIFQKAVGKLFATDENYIAGSGEIMACI